MKIPLSPNVVSGAPETNKRPSAIDGIVGNGRPEAGSTASNLTPNVIFPTSSTSTLIGSEEEGGPIGSSKPGINTLPLSPNVVSVISFLRVILLLAPEKHWLLN